MRTYIKSYKLPLDTKRGSVKLTLNQTSEPSHFSRLRKNSISPGSTSLFITKKMLMNFPTSIESREERLLLLMLIEPFSASLIRSGSWMSWLNLNLIRPSLVISSISTSRGFISMSESKSSIYKEASHSFSLFANSVSVICMTQSGTTGCNTVLAPTNQSETLGSSLRDSIYSVSSSVAFLGASGSMTSIIAGVGGVYSMFITA